MTTWGQLRYLLAHGGAGIIDDADTQLRAAEPVARALEAACEAWRIGRGRSVDRAVLLDSEAVSGSFIDRVAKLNMSLNGDAKQLITKLEAGEVDRWRQKNTAKLRDYLLDEGYLAAEEPLEPEDLRVRVLAAAVRDLEQKAITKGRLERVYQTVGV